MRLYTNIRNNMAEIYTGGEFGVVEVKETKTRHELATEKIRYEMEKKGIRNGYERIKTKSKEIRQNYQKAASEGRRSGNGKIVCDNWEELKAVYGGSPATTCIENSVSSVSVDDELGFGVLDCSDSDREEQEDDKMSEGICSEVVATAETNDISNVFNAPKALTQGRTPCIRFFLLECPLHLGSGKYIIITQATLILRRNSLMTKGGT